MTPWYKDKDCLVIAFLLAIGIFCVWLSFHANAQSTVDQGPALRPHPPPIARPLFTQPKPLTLDELNQLGAEPDTDPQKSDPLLYNHGYNPGYNSGYGVGANSYPTSANPGYQSQPATSGLPGPTIPGLTGTPLKPSTPWNHGQ